MADVRKYAMAYSNASAMYQTFLNAATQSDEAHADSSPPCVQSIGYMPFPIPKDTVDRRELGLNMDCRDMAGGSKSSNRVAARKSRATRERVEGTRTRGSLV
jgi:hypothetical protein